MQTPQAVIVTVGEELLRGEITDTNSAWLGQRLNELGFRVRAGFSVGDNLEDISSCLKQAVEAAPAVIVTGGLGPTGDDLSAHAAARFAEVELVRSEAAVENIARRLKCPLSEVTGSRLRMAMVPDGAKVYPNSEGSAPGIHLKYRPRADGPRPTEDRRRPEEEPFGGPASGEVPCAASPGPIADIFLLPGVPREMKAIFNESVAPELDRLFPDRARPCSRLLHLSGWPESHADREAREVLRSIIGEGAVDLGTRLGRGWVTLRVSANGAGAAAAVDEAVELLKERFGDGIWGEDGQDLARVTGEALIAGGTSLATAESCTGGMVAAELVGVPGISSVFLQGLVTYSNRAKQDLLGVDAGIIERHGAVSRQCAEAMATGLRTKCAADITLAITGIAGPEGGTPEKPVGTVHFALDGPQGLQHEVLCFGGSRDWVRQRASSHALWLIWRSAASR